jgi:hypothetical protein
VEANSIRSNKLGRRAFVISQENDEHKTRFTPLDDF